MVLFTRYNGIANNLFELRLFMSEQVSIIENYELQGKLLEIAKFPEPVLKKKAKEVENFDDTLRELVKNMLYTMYKAPGVGLAAPQVFHSIRALVMDTSFKRDELESSTEENPQYSLTDLDPKIIINPVITEKEGEIVYEEGCLSVPGIYEKVKRFNKITLEYQNEFGNKLSLEAEGFMAVCIQHEIDHLNGIVFLERLSALKRQFLTKKFLKKNK